VPKNIPSPATSCATGRERAGTFKDRIILERDPHRLIEGCVLTAYAVESHQAYIYIRGEYGLPIRRVSRAVEEAYAAGYLGKNILGSGFDCDLTVYAGAGAYICGRKQASSIPWKESAATPGSSPPFRPWSASMAGPP